ncbi:MAG TPA: hypothetical protein VIR63_04620 [Pontiella sp.]
MWLMEFRNSHPAFEGDIEILNSPENQLALRRAFAEDWAEVHIDLKSHTTELLYTTADGEKKRIV